MKFLKLYLEAYGPFTNIELEFPSGTQSINIVYGLNEAGKSSTLRALTSLLFGISPKTTDDFVHDKSTLRVGALLRHSDGTEKAFYRRKGNKNTLLNETGDSINDSEISPYLAGLTREVFETMYGINAETLSKGGQELVLGGGEIKTALFSAAAGIPEIRGLLKTVDGQAEELFKPRGSTQHINRLIKKYDESKKSMKELSLTVREWEELTKQVDELNNKSTALKNSIIEKNATLEHKRRQFEVLQDVGELKAIQSEQEAKGVVVTLPEDFSGTRKKCEEKLCDTQEKLEKNISNLRDLEEAIKLLKVPENLLSLQDRITDIFQESGNYKQGREQLPRLQGNFLEIKRDCKRILRELKINSESDDFKQYCITIQDYTRIEELCEERVQLDSNLNHHQSSLKVIEIKIKQLQNKLANEPTPKDPALLQQTLNSSRQNGLTEKSITKLQNETNELAETIKCNLKLLRLKNLTLDGLLSLIVPKKSTVNKFATSFQKIEQKSKENIKNIEKENQILVELEDNISFLQKESALPTEDELEESRKHRNKGWSIIKSTWLDGTEHDNEELKNFCNGSVNLAEAYENAVTKSDKISDRLRHESERVAKMAQLLIQKERSAKRLKDLEAEEKDIQREKNSLNKDWKEAWVESLKKPDTPEEMHEWFDLYEDTFLKCKEWKEKTNRLNNEQQQIDKNKSRLQELILKFDSALNNQENNLESLYLIAENLVTTQNNVITTTNKLKEQINEQQEQAEFESHEINKLKDNLEQWKKSWKDGVKSEYLDSCTTVTQAKATLKKFDELAKKVKDMEERESRIMAIESDGRRFKAVVEDLCKNLDRPIDDIEHAVIIELLNRELKDGLGKFVRLQNLKQKEGELNNNIIEAKQTIDLNNKILQDLCKKAECENQEELPSKEAISFDYLKNKNRIAELRRIISRSTGGVELDQFLKELNNIDIDILPSEMKELNLDIAQMEKTLYEANQEIGAKKRELEVMEKGHEATEKSEEMAQILAEIKDKAEEYSSLVLAISAIREAMELYRKDNQTPVVKRASELFKRLTLNSFEGLTTDYDKDDLPILVGLRNGKRIFLSGMSEGTCDQLYLALRLACLEQSLNNAEPMPLILDDMLINFDNERVNEALKILEELSNKTQIILFTHHKHIRDIAMQSLLSNELYILDL